MYFIIFLKEHNSFIIHNLEYPKFYYKEKYLKLGNDVINQLDLIENKSDDFYSCEKNKIKSLFDVINFTKTICGKRFLRFQMLHPLLEKKEIQKRYDMIDLLSNEKINIINELKEINDIERLIRKISLQTIHPREFYKFIISMENILIIFQKV